MVEVDTQGSLDDMLAEVDAMHMSLRLVSTASPSDEDVREARNLTRKAYVGFATPKNFEQQVTACAMGYILGDDVRRFVPKAPIPAPWEQHVYETIGRAWALWAADPSSPAPCEEIARLRREQKDREDATEMQRDGAVHLIALYFWAAAVEALAKGDLSEAQRFWKRSMEVGSSFGTDSHPVVLWTYAATFFP